MIWIHVKSSDIGNILILREHPVRRGRIDPQLSGDQREVKDVCLQVQVMVVRRLD